MKHSGKKYFNAETAVTTKRKKYRYRVSWAAWTEPGGWDFKQYTLDEHPFLWLRKEQAFNSTSVLLWWTQLSALDLKAYNKAFPDGE